MYFSLFFTFFINKKIVLTMYGYCSMGAPSPPIIFDPLESDSRIFAATPTEVAPAPDRSAEQMEISRINNEFGAQPRIHFHFHSSFYYNFFLFSTARSKSELNLLGTDGREWQMTSWQSDTSASRRIIVPPKLLISNIPNRQYL